tara:strand:+ start:341 stop:700 length:360 start_codon:yes stop_codon:yes gene_type:complete
MKYNNEIVGNQYEIREIVILNWINYFTTNKEKREDMKTNLQLYLQQEEHEVMKLADVTETDYEKRLNIIFDNICKLSELIESRDFDSSEANMLITNILVCTDTDEKRVEREWKTSNKKD